MKKILIVTLFLTFNYTSNLVAETNCDNAINKLKPDCNFIGEGFKSLKKFSSKHKTIGQSLGIKSGERKTLKEFSKENKTIGQTLKNIREKKKNDNRK